MPDGVGATVKRVADRAVLRGHDITDANSMYKVVKPNTTIKLYSIQDEAFVKTKSDYGVGGLSIPTVPGTMRIHQIMTDTPGKISYRNVSCYCSSGKMCDCYELKHFCFPVLTVTTAADTLAPTEVELRDASCKSLIDEYVVVKRTLSPYFRNSPLLHITIRLHLTSRLLKFMQWLARKQYVLCSW